MKVIWEKTDIYPGLVVANENDDKYMVAKVIGKSYGTGAWTIVALQRGSVYELSNPTLDGLLEVLNNNNHTKFELNLGK